MVACIVGQKPRLSSAIQKLRELHGLSWQFQLFVFLICAAAVISRRPDAILNPEFHAEDRAVWYTDAYSSGWLISLMSPLGGYLNTLQRLIAAGTLVLPFYAVPLAMNLTGLTLQVLPVNLLLSGRAMTWGGLPLRLAYALVYIALPNSSEVHIVITNSQFHFALLALLLLTAKPPRTLAWKIIDGAVLAIIGVTGPFCFVLLPITLFLWWKQRDRWYLKAAAVLAVFAAVQAIEIFFAISAQRPPVNLGASFPLFLRLLGGRLYLAALLGGTLGVRLHFPIVAVAAVIATMFVVYCLLNANLPLRLFVFFSAVLLAGSLLRPPITDSTPAWVIMLYRGGANRYWFFPSLAFLWCVVWCATHRTWRPARVIAICALLVSVRGIVRDWRFHPFDDDHFQKYAAEFARANEGDLVMFRIYPSSWTMRLTKKGPGCPYVPEGRIEQPKSNARVNGMVPVSGWVAASEPVASVLLYLDGTLVQTVARAGGKWSTRLDLSAMSPGRHELLLRAREQTGCDAALDAVTLTR